MHINRRPTRSAAGAELEPKTSPSWSLFVGRYATGGWPVEPGRQIGLAERRGLAGAGRFLRHSHTRPSRKSRATSGAGGILLAPGATCCWPAPKRPASNSTAPNSDFRHLLPADRLTTRLGGQKLQFGQPAAPTAVAQPGAKWPRRAEPTTGPRSRPLSGRIGSDLAIGSKSGRRPLQS